MIQTADQMSAKRKKVSPELSTEERLHHLSKDRRGRWEVRIRIQNGLKLVGTPVRIRLGRISEAEAVRQRDIHLRVLGEVGALVMLRKQKRGYLDQK